MKLTKKSSGFSIVLVLVVLACIIILGLVGWLVYRSATTSEQDDQSQSQTEEQSNNQTTVTPVPAAEVQTSDSPAGTEVGEVDAVDDPSDFLEPYQLPKGWVAKQCFTGGVAITPPEASDPNCASNQPNTVISMSILDSSQAAGRERCEVAKERSVNRGAAIKKYDCSDQVVDGKGGIRELVEFSAEGVSGGATQITYSFIVDGSVLAVTYMNMASRNLPDYTAAFDSFVGSLKFQ